MRSPEDVVYADTKLVDEIANTLAEMCQHPNCETKAYGTWDGQDLCLLHGEELMSQQPEPQEDYTSEIIEMKDLISPLPIAKPAQPGKTCYTCWHDEKMKVPATYSVNAVCFCAFHVPNSVKEADPELEKLLAEEEKIEAETKGLIACKSCGKPAVQKGSISGTPYCQYHGTGKSTIALDADTQNTKWMKQNLAEPTNAMSMDMVEGAIAKEKAKASGLVCYQCSSKNPTHGVGGGKLMCHHCYSSFKIKGAEKPEWKVPLPKSPTPDNVTAWIKEMALIVEGHQQLNAAGVSTDFSNPECCAGCKATYKKVAKLIKEEVTKVEHTQWTGGPGKFECPACSGQHTISMSEADICDVCGCVFNWGCCTHYFCVGCNKHFDQEDESQGCNECEKCIECMAHAADEDCYNGPEDDMPSFSEGSENGASAVPPWVERGKEIVFPDTVGIDNDWEAQWKIGATEIDLAKLMAEFYLLGACAQGCVNIPFLVGRWHEQDPWLRFLKEAAQADLDRLVNDHVKRLTAYVCMAVGGELRYHKAVEGASGFKGDRTAMWVKWKYILDQVGPQAMADAGKLFREMGGGSIGGIPWAVAAETCHMYMTGRISAFIWMDRMFTMQHNCGSLFNKISWKTKNDVRWNIDACKRYIGPAHSANPTDWPVLLIIASEEVRAKFREQWAYGNRMKLDWNMPRERCPKEADGWNFRGGWGLTRTVKGTDGNNYEVVVEKHATLGKKARMKGLINEMCQWIAWESPKIVHIEKGKLPPGIELTYHEGNGHKAIKFPSGKIKSITKSTTWDNLFEYCWVPMKMQKSEPEVYAFWAKLPYKDKHELCNALLSACKSGEIKWPDKVQWKKDVKKKQAQQIADKAKSSLTMTPYTHSGYYEEVKM